MTQQPEKKSADSESASPVVSDDRRESRRRLLRMGVKAAPAVAATLVGQQALACHCTIPSAWGSISKATGNNDMGLVNLGQGSIAARYGSSIIKYSNQYRGYTKWTKVGLGWNALVVAANMTGYSWPTKSTNWTDPEKKQWLQGLLKVGGVTLKASQLVKIFFSSIDVSAWANKVPVRVTTGSAGAGDQAVLIAFLARATGATWPISGNEPCLTLEQLASMGNRTFKTSLDGSFWGDTKIVDYLNGNWMVRTTE